MSPPATPGQGRVDLYLTSWAVLYIPSVNICYYNYVGLITLTWWQLWFQTPTHTMATPYSYGYLLQLWIPPTAMATPTAMDTPQLQLQLWLPPTALSVSYERACYLHWVGACYPLPKLFGSHHPSLLRRSGDNFQLAT